MTNIFKHLQQSRPKLALSTVNHKAQYCILCFLSGTGMIVGSYVGSPVQYYDTL